MYDGFNSVKSVIYNNIQYIINIGFKILTVKFKEMEKKIYVAPVVKHVEFKVEAGFRQSEPQGDVFPQMEVNTQNYQQDDNWHASSFFGNN